MLSLEYGNFDGRLRYDKHSAFIRCRYVIDPRFNVLSVEHVRSLLCQDESDTLYHAPRVYIYLWSSDVSSLEYKGFLCSSLLVEPPQYEPYCRRIFWR